MRYEIQITYTKKCTYTNYNNYCSLSIDLNYIIIKSKIQLFVA